MRKILKNVCSFLQELYPTYLGEPSFQSAKYCLNTVGSPPSTTRAIWQKKVLEYIKNEICSGENFF